MNAASLLAQADAQTTSDVELEFGEGLADGMGADKLSDDEKRKIAENWIARNKTQLQKMFCGQTERKKFEGFWNRSDVALAEVVINLIAAKFTGIPAGTLLKLLSKYGLEKICAP